MPAKIRRDLFFGDIISLTPDELKVISAGIKLPDINSQLKDTSDKLSEHIKDSTLEFDSIKTNVATNYYTKTTIEDIVATVKKNAFSIVTALPETGEEGIIYLIKKNDENIHTQYIWENNDYINLGDTTLNLDNYYTKAMIDSKYTALNALIESEATQRKTEDTAIKTSIDTETKERKAADETLTTNLATEVTDRTTGDTNTLAKAKELIDAEATRAKNAESTLESKITAENLARQNADSAIQSSITDEASKRESGDTTTLTDAKAYTDKQLEALEARLAALESAADAEY